jgi:hypothetical protein
MLTGDRQSTLNFVQRHKEVVEDRRDREQLAGRFSEEMAMFKSELLNY